MKNQDSTRTPKQLGELESQVMGVIWDKGAATVQDVKDALAPEKELAYTTVMTVMSRLTEKGMLIRHKEGRAYVYRAADSQETVAGSLLYSLVRRFYKGATVSAIAQLLETEEEVDDAELDRLEKLIQAKRRDSKS